MTGNEIRRRFLDYFAGNGHRIVRSSSLVPVGDPTLLFANAGMNQFKDVFLGLEQRDYQRATSCQKCVRAGGKHNDLENVGRTARHHTFFEMLGNFSFGDYFKKEAIALAWELVTSSNWFGLPKEKLYATIFKGEEGLARDAEAYNYWAAQGVPTERIFEFGIKDNFWAMGDTGPCGPCSELHYDLGPAASELGHTDCVLGCDCGRYVEIWNLVFMQFNRDAGGAMAPLPKPSVDTGAGLERLAAVIQGKVSNFDTDLLRPLINSASGLSSKDYGQNPRIDMALRVIADHSRAAAFLVCDGVIPSNEGRGYVLRKIIRRACDFGRQLGLSDHFLYKMAGDVAEIMREPYPELMNSLQRVATVIKGEEAKYQRLVVPAEEQLIKRFQSRPVISPGDLTAIQEFGREGGVYSERAIEQAKLQRRFEKEEGRIIVQPQDFLFAYGTLGLRPDYVRDIAAAQGWFIPEGTEEEFRELLGQERERAKASWKGVTKQVANPIYTHLAETYRTEPHFYFATCARDCRIEAIVTREGLVEEIAPGAEAEAVLDRTVIYAEAGGQVADVGSFYTNDLADDLAEVRGAYYPVAGLIAHRIVARQALHVGDRVAAVADAERRGRTRRNHTATHLMHAALRNVLGTHVKQAGSLVAPDRLRFDFSHFAQLDSDELAEIEEQVNQEILHNAELQTDIMPLDDALASGALAFFGDKYPEQNVRVVTIPDPAASRRFYSKELCGGTHVKRTGDIGVFKILAEQSVAAGVRRIEAITGERALADYQHAFRTLRSLSAALGVAPEDLLGAVERLSQTTKQLERQLDTLKKKTAHSQLDELLERTRTVKDVRVVSALVAGLGRAAMRQLADALRQKLGSGVVVLGATDDGKIALIAAVTKDLTARLHAGKIIQSVAQQVGGSGGGRADLAEAGGKDTSALEKAIDQVYELVGKML